MNIHLSKMYAREVQLTPYEDEKSENFNLSVGSGFSDGISRSFIIKFEIDYVSDELYKLAIVYEAFFETDEDITPDFQNSHFPKVNAPAIAYPFLRSFVSTLTVNAGYESVLLPTVNFLAIAKEREEAQRLLEAQK